MLTWHVNMEQRTMAKTEWFLDTSGLLSLFDEGSANHREAAFVVVLAGHFAPDPPILSVRRFHLSVRGGSLLHQLVELCLLRRW